LRHHRLQKIASKLPRWAADRAESLSTDPPIPEELSDRQGDISVPLLAVADTAGGEWPKLVRDALVEAFGVDAGTDLEVKTDLLRDIRCIFQAVAGGTAVHLSSADLCRQLIALEGARWAELSKGKPITQYRLASLLKDFKIRPHPVGPDHNVRGYELTDFQNAWRRYLPAPGIQGFQGVQNPGNSSVSEQNQGVQPAAAGHPETAQEMAENCHSGHPGHPEGGGKADGAEYRTADADRAQTAAALLAAGERGAAAAAGGPADDIQSARQHDLGHLEDHGAAVDQAIRLLSR
jgi:hypothetical protein